MCPVMPEPAAREPQAQACFWTCQINERQSTSSDTPWNGKNFLMFGDGIERRDQSANGA